MQFTFYSSQLCFSRLHSFYSLGMSTRYIRRSRLKYSVNESLSSFASSFTIFLSGICTPCYHFFFLINNSFWSVYNFGTSCFAFILKLLSVSVFFKLSFPTRPNYFSPLIRLRGSTSATYLIIFYTFGLSHFVQTRKHLRSGRLKKPKKGRDLLLHVCSISRKLIKMK